MYSSTVNRSAVLSYDVCFTQQLEMSAAVAKTVCYLLFKDAFSSDLLLIDLLSICKQYKCMIIVCMFGYHTNQFNFQKPGSVLD